MNAPVDLRLDKAAFNCWLDAQERKFEWTEGRVVQMTTVTRGHSRIVRNIARALEARLDIERWSVVTSDFGVERVSFVRFPDVVVEPEAASQDEPICWLWARDASGTFATKPQKFVGREQAVPLVGLAIELPLAEIYRGVRTGDQN